MIAIANHGTRPRSTVPWRPNHAIGAAALNVVGLLVLLAGWFGVSGTAKLSHQFAWTTVSIGGFLLGAFGNAVWLLSGRRSVGIRRRQLLAEPVGPAGTVHPLGRRDSTEEIEVVLDQSDFVTAPGMTRYHTHSCLLVQGKSRLVHHDPAARRSADLEPCGMCQS